ncbi:MAG: SDR family NAD(P)-dependent oxidoreductase [Simkaniaceae bacterium]
MQRTVLVTGASSGIGKAISEKLLKRGCSVLGLSRKAPDISHPNFFSEIFDLSRIEKIPDLARKLLFAYPKVNALICNAGIGLFGNLEECSYTEISHLLHLNLHSQIFLVKSFLPYLKRQASSDVLFIGSEAGIQGRRKGSIYCASKFALRGFAQALREECSASNVRISTIQPGMVRTSFHDDLYFEPGEEDSHALQPEDIAEAVDMVLHLPSHAVCDEIRLSPLKKVVRFKKMC